MNQPRAKRLIAFGGITEGVNQPRAKRLIVFGGITEGVNQSPISA